MVRSLILKVIFRHSTKLNPTMGLQFRSSAVFGKLEWPLAIIVLRSYLAWYGCAWRRFRLESLFWADWAFQPSKALCLRLENRCTLDILFNTGSFCSRTFPQGIAHSLLGALWCMWNVACWWFASAVTYSFQQAHFKSFSRRAFNLGEVLPHIVLMNSVISIKWTFSSKVCINKAKAQDNTWHPSPSFCLDLG